MMTWDMIEETDPLEAALARIPLNTTVAPPVNPFSTSPMELSVIEKDEARSVMCDSTLSDTVYSRILSREKMFVNFTNFCGYSYTKILCEKR